MTRPNSGAYTTEIAITAFSRPGPSIAATPMASSSAGKLNRISKMRPMTVSTQPP
jgi:hypothetical protein